MKSSNHIRRLAILYPKAIGDFVFILPALHTIRRALRDVHITLAVKAKQAPLAVLQKRVLVDEVLVFGGGTGWRAMRGALSDLNVDAVVDMAGNDQAGLLSAFRGGRRVRPHWQDCKGVCALYSLFAESMPRMQAGMHRVDELLAYARYLGATEPVYSFKLEIPGRAIEAGERIIAERDLRSGTVIALNPGASRETKRWPAEHFLALARELIARGHRVVLTGAREFKADGHYDRGIPELFSKEGLLDGEKCINLISSMNLEPSLQLQRDAYFLRYSNVSRVVVGNDTGPMHIAGSVGEDARNKTISLFGPTNWGRYAPYDPSRSFPDRPAGTWNRVLCSGVDCGPAGCRESCSNYRGGCRHTTCMQTLSPETVFGAITEMIGKT